MSRLAHAIAPVLKLALIVVIIAAWVEANAKRVQPDPAPAASVFGKAPPAPGFDPLRPSAPRAKTDVAPPAGDCAPRIDRRNVERVAPARPAVIET